jgi:rhodanese-related sulfurtransferase
MRLAALTPAELIARLASPAPPVVVDVRSRTEFAAGHVPGARNIPFNEIGEHLAEIPSGAEVVLYCGHGPRAWLAAAAMRRRGRDRIRFLKGHWAGWRRARRPAPADPRG